MSTMQKLVTKRVEDGAVWIEGPLTAPPDGINMPLVIGREWLMEIVRTETGRTHSTRIEEIASALGVSHPHLTRRFKSDFGLTPLEYQHRLRVSEAISALSR